ncbi:MAG TPA: DUF4388 domain-containing protein [Fibrobacteria bacterium]|nr:DUF4388 domain-containing protein [Fibrobacteria bacterium]
MGTVLFFVSIPLIVAALLVGIRALSLRRSSDASLVDGDGAWVARIPQFARRLVESSQGTGTPAAPDSALLQGNLAQIPLHDLLQYLALGRKSGVLELASGRRAGRIMLEAGRISRCVYRGKEGLDAAFLLLDLAEGDFEYRERAWEAPAASTAAPGGSAPVDAVDVIMLWMARKSRHKQPSSG